MPRSHRRFWRAFIIIAIIGTFAFAAACTPLKVPTLPNPPPPPTLPKLPALTPPTLPTTTTTTTPPADPTCASTTSPTATASSTPSTLSTKAAKAQAADAVADAQADTGASHVPLTVIEDSPDGPIITTQTVTSPAAASTVAGAAAADGDLLGVQVPQRTQMVTASSSPVAPASVSNDTYRSSQWALNDVAFETAWTKTNGAGVTVAVIDTGVQSNHPELTGHVIKGCEFLKDSNAGVRFSGVDQNGHATHVAGIIAASANNTAGITGAAPGVNILAVRVLDANGSGWDTDVARGMIWAVNNGAKVLNLSLSSNAVLQSDGTMSTSPAEIAAVNWAESHDVTVVAAAGNNGATGNAVSYPAAIPNVLAVGAVDSTNTRAYFSTSQSYVGIAAPGASILSTYPTNLLCSGGPATGYCTLSGTSMASPYAAATAALVKAQYPSYTPAQVRTRITTTALDLGTAGHDSLYGWGLIDPAAAVGLP